jgi:hypothetical protein
MVATLRFKFQFFDQARVIKAAGRARARVLAEYGRKVRRRAQASLHYIPGPSAPGRPPHAHKTRKIRKTSRSTGKVRVRSVSFLREFLFYQYDPATNSVVIGPERLNSTVDPAALPALEYGGTSTITSGGRRKPASIAARPFMGPADAAERPGLSALWRDSIK